MKDLLSTYKEKSNYLNIADQKMMEAFIKKMLTFTHAPGSYKHAQRMEKFAANKELVSIVASTLLTYSLDHEENDIKWFDIISYWYSMALLCFSKTNESAEVLHNITDKMISIKFKNLSILRRTFGFFESDPFIKPLSQKVEAYYKSIKSDVDAHTWAESIGLVLPDNDWRIMFLIGTNGEKEFSSQVTEEEKLTRFEIRVRVFSRAEGNSESWEIELFNTDRTIVNMRWENSKDNALYMGLSLKKYTLDVAPSLLNFKNFLTHLEQTLNIKFARKITDSLFSKGIKNKAALDKWLND